MENTIDGSINASFLPYSPPLPTQRRESPCTWKKVGLRIVEIALPTFIMAGVVSATLYYCSGQLQNYMGGKIENVSGTLETKLDTKVDSAVNQIEQWIIASIHNITHMNARLKALQNEIAALNRQVQPL